MNFNYLMELNFKDVGMSISGDFTFSNPKMIYNSKFSQIKIFKSIYLTFLVMRDFIKAKKYPKRLKKIFFWQRKLQKAKNH